MRRVVIPLLSLCLAVALAGSAIAGDGKLSFTTGNFTVTCTSTGQFCKPGKRLAVTLPRTGTMTRVIYTTAKTHCSAVRIFVLRGSRTVAKLPRLDAGDATASVGAKVPLKEGTTTLRFRAKGFTGGCNAGQLGSWGGKITVKVSLD